jgi:ferredoxin
MIVAERKPFDQIWESVKGARSLLLLGCGTCVSVCQSGGEKEVGLLASELRMKSRLDGLSLEIAEATVQRQCDREFFETVKANIPKYDLVLSLACGAGVQFAAEVLEPVRVVPALNTRFIGVTAAEGVWAERCRACGSCVLADYGGICPVTVCAKGLLSGPCGGSRQGKCEASQEKDCAWVLIYNRLKKQGRLDNLRPMREPKDHSKQAHPGLYVNEAYQKPEVKNAE